MRNTALLLRESAIELNHRDAIARPRTFDESNLTIEAVIASSNPVRRRDQRGEFMEILDPAGLDIESARGASVLNSHNQSGLASVLGTIDDIWIEGAEVIARIRFSSRPEIAPIVADVRAGIISFLSVGYQVEAWKPGKDAGGARTMTATKWTVREASFVPVPADATARTRGAFDPDARQPDTTRAIHELARRAGVPVTRADALIELGASIDDARRAFLSDIIDRAVTVRSGRDHNTMSIDNPEIFQRAVGEALFCRVTPSHTPSGAARQYIGMRIADIAAETLRRSGIGITGMSADALITRALHSTSDFPLILADTVGRTMRVAYQAPPAGIRQLARETTAADFRTKHRLQLDAMGFLLEKVPEDAEYKRGTMVEAGESYAVDTYGKVFAISRKALINDDLGAFASIPRQLGQAAIAFEAQFLVDLLISQAGLGPVMSDGNKVFDATNHKNYLATHVGGADAPSVTSLSATRLLMRKQTGPGGGLIAATPRYLLVPSDLETIADQIVFTTSPVTLDQVNPFQRLIPVVEPRLTDTLAWYLVADASQIDGLEFAYLAGAPGPQIESRAGFDVDGVEIKVRLDFGAGFIDWRSWVKNEGLTS